MDDHLFRKNLKIIEKPLQKLSELKQIKKGLRNKKKEIAPKFFYDAKGSELFNKICETDAYYQTRTEMSLLHQKANAIGDLLGNNRIILEPGAGNMRKIRPLFKAVKPERYLGIDISKQEVVKSSYGLAIDFPEILIFGIVGDFLHIDNDELSQLIPDASSRSVFFPGSTIGNFAPDQAQEFLAQTAMFVGNGGIGIFGIDLVKPSKILNMAYNDPQGFTRDFNLNLLTRLNREFGANFDLKAFEHEAIYREDKCRIEMHLVSSRRQVVILGGEIFQFSEGEKIHTENSYKYTKQSFERLAENSNFALKAFFTDDREYFGIAIVQYQFDTTKNF